MKTTLLLLVLACAHAQENERDATIVRSDVIKYGANRFISEQETSNQIRQTASGESIPGAEPETGSFIMRGAYSYLAPDGQNITVTWYADETGYHAFSDAIPQNVEPLRG